MDGSGRLLQQSGWSPKIWEVYLIDIAGNESLRPEMTTRDRMIVDSISYPKRILKFPIFFENS